MIYKNNGINTKYKIFIVEDHPIFKFGLEQLINQQDDLIVCEDTDNAHDALNMISQSKPDLVIVDLSLKESSGLELTYDLNQYFNDLPVLILSMHENPTFAEKALKNGARGYVTKQETYDSIVKAIRKVLSGDMYISNNISDKLIGKMVGTKDSQDINPLDDLTPREFEIFECIGNGMSTKKIAQYLTISSNTVNTYRERIKEKLNLKNSTELLKAAIIWSQQNNENNVV